MQGFISAEEAAERWGISEKRVIALCSESRVSGACMPKNAWLIPTYAEMPSVDAAELQDRSTGRIKPFVKWAGGKGQLIEQIGEHIPHDFCRYAEPFVGGGAFLLSLLSERDIKEIYISDINAELINVYKAIQNDVDGLICKLSVHQKEFLSADIEQKIFISMG